MAEVLGKDSCRNCKFYQGDVKDTEGKGQCRRNPPLLAGMHPEKGPMYSFVVVRASWWCGEYQDKIELMH